MEHRICENPDGSVFYMSEEVNDNIASQEQTEQIINIQQNSEEQSRVLIHLQMYRTRVRKFCIFDIIFSILQYLFFVNSFFIIAGIFNIWVMKYQRDLNSNYKMLILSSCFILNIIRLLGLILLMTQNYTFTFILLLLGFLGFYIGQSYHLKYMIYYDILSSQYRNNTIIND